MIELIDYCPICGQEIERNSVEKEDVDMDELEYVYDVGDLYTYEREAKNPCKSCNRKKERNTKQ